VKAKIVISSLLVIVLLAACNITGDKPKPQDTSDKPILNLDKAKSNKKMDSFDFTKLPMEVTTVGNEHTLTYADGIRNIAIVAENLVYKEIPNVYKDDVDKKQVATLLEGYEKELKKSFEEDKMSGLTINKELTTVSVLSPTDKSKTSVGARYTVSITNGETTQIKIVSIDYHFKNNVQAKSEITIVMDNKEIEKQGDDYINLVADSTLNGDVNTIVQSIEWAK
jgi:hypothetical protein